MNAETIAPLHGLDDAIMANPLIGDDRRDFLLDRLDYWQELGRREIGGENLGVRWPSDWE